MLGIHTTDFSIGEAFFGNKEFMRHDVQAVACADYLRELFPDKVYFLVLPTVRFVTYR